MKCIFCKKPNRNNKGVLIWSGLYTVKDRYGDIIFFSVCPDCKKLTFEDLHKHIIINKELTYKRVY